MFLDYAESIVQLLAALAALSLSLFQFISHKHRGWRYAVILDLGILSGCYFWATYQVVMGESPNVSEWLTYFGWDVALAVLLMLVWHIKSPEERRYFHPLMLLPVPLNIWQLTLYLPYGGEVNSIFQVAACTGIACLCIQSFCWSIKKRGSGLQPPWVAAAALLYVVCEFGMWTSTCFDAPVSDLYFPFSFLFSADFLFLTWALVRWYRTGEKQAEDPLERRIKRALKTSFLLVMLVSCIGGILLSIWMRNTLTRGGENAAETGVYDIIPVVLFMITLFLVVFAVTIIFVVVFREKAVENGRLREARQIAEHSNAVKSDFLANMSHEIRTPINAVLGMNEVILRDSLEARDDPPEEREKLRAVFRDISICAGNIESAGNSLLSLINDILDVSRIEAGKLEITETDYKLSAVLNDVSNMIAIKTRAKGLEFRIDVDETLPDGLRGDGVRVRQIMTNLLNNAVKYTDRGRILLAVNRGGEEKAAAGRMMDLVIRVEDTGIGIREEDLGRLFTKFERMEPERNSTVEGSGLGLSITRSLLDMMGGHIEVSSVYGEGSVFTATIPQQVVSCEPAGNFRMKPEQDSMARTAHRGLFRAPDARILIVDDTRMNLAVVKGLLKNTGIRTDEAESGEEAAALARTVPYDVILMDQRMPKMDGTETMRQIRKDQDSLNRETPIICLTADAIIGAKERYLAKGFTDYLAKPVDGPEMERILMKYLPAGKVIPLSGKGREAEDGAPGHADPEGDRFAWLRRAGVVPETGIRYCREDEELYRSLLAEFAAAEGEKTAGMEKACAAQDWETYGILAHSVKSMSRTIGAEELAEAAAALERAAENMDGRAVESGHRQLLEQYRSIAAAIRQAIAPPKEEAIEFLPE